MELFFDTAPCYGYGKSEELLGQALKPVREKVIICTLFSHNNPDGSYDFNAEKIRPIQEGSLWRWQTDNVDMLLLHNPPPELMDGQLAAQQYETLEALKAAGSLHDYGISLDWREEVELAVETMCPNCMRGRRFDPTLMLRQAH